MADPETPATVPQDSHVALQECLKSCNADEACTSVSFTLEADGTEQCGKYESTEPMIGQGEEGDTARCFLKTAHEVNAEYFEEI